MERSGSPFIVRHREVIFNGQGWFAFIVRHREVIFNGKGWLASTCMHAIRKSFDGKEGVVYLQMSLWHRVVILNWKRWVAFKYVYGLGK